MNDNIQEIHVVSITELPRLSWRYSMAVYPTAGAAANAHERALRGTVKVVYAYLPSSGRFGCWAIPKEPQ